MEYKQRRVDRRRHLTLKAKTPSPDLSPEEYFIWSQIREGIRLRQLIPICPWTPKETLERIESMIQKNSAEWHDDPKLTSLPPEIQKQMEADDQDSELQKLDRNFRLEVMAKFIEPHLDNHYAVLEIHQKASDAEIKAKYLELSKQFHPDRFFKKKLGHYKPKLDVIFTRLQKAYAALKNPIEREAHDRTLSIKNRTPQTKPATEAPSAPKKMPVMDKQMEQFGKAEFHFKAGQESEKEKDYLTAYNSYALAYQINPKRDIYQKALETVKPYMQKQKAQKILDQVKANMKLVGSSEEFLKLLDETLQLDPSLAEAHLYLGRLILELNISARFSDAKEMLRRAKASLPRSADAPYYLARALHHLGDDKAALREIDEALKRDPKHQNAKKLSEKLR